MKNVLFTTLLVVVKKYVKQLGISADDAPVNTRYGGFLVHVDGVVDEEQLTAVLRVIGNVD